MVPLTPIRGSSIADRLQYWSTPVTETGCILWFGSTEGSGYGSLNVDGEMRKAHRLAWEQVNGRIPEGMYVDHRCGVRSCVNPDHLRLATPSQNVAHSIKIRSDNKSGRRGVHWNARLGYWAVWVAGRSFGMYADIEDAARVASEKRKEIYGEFAGVDK